MAVNNLSFSVPTLDFSQLRISTITTTAQLGTTIHLDALFNQIKIMPYWDLDDGILKMEFKGITKGTSFKDIMLKQKETKKSFFNQATLVVRREISDQNWKEINVKLFRNGGVQMTGVRSIEMSGDTIRWLINYINTTCTESPVFSTAPTITKEEIQLINTDFSIGAKVRRDNLHRILSEKYGLNSSYESAIYQGVKTKFFYNAQRAPTTPPGVCRCPTLCKGTGDGTKIGDCKKITISPFQTGQVIITGARAMEQINEAYEFIKKVFSDNADEILRKVYALPPDVAATTATSTTIGPSAPPTAKDKPAKVSTGWIQHPCPRNIVRKIVK